MSEFNPGSGADGALTITTTRTEDTARGVSNISSAASAGQKDVTLASATSFSADEWVLLIQMTGTGSGNYEFAQIASKSSNTLTMKSNLALAYAATGAQCLRMGQYSSATVSTGGTWTTSGWNGTTGGVLAAMISGSLTVDSGRTIDVDGLGFAGGAGAQFDFGGTGQGPGGGSGGDGRFACSQGGGGGGHKNAGSAGTMNGCGGGPGGAGGGSYDPATIATAQMGSGGGGGAKAGTGGTNGGGGAGGGIIILVVGGTITVNGNVYARGVSGVDGTDGADGGGGSGGAVRFLCRNLVLGTALVKATGGAAVGNSGAGSDGIVATISSTSVSGTTSPTIDTSSTDTVLMSLSFSDSLTITESTNVAFNLTPFVLDLTQGSWGVTLY